MDGPRRHAVFILNAESLPHLVKSNGLVSFGFSQIQLKVYKSDQAPKPNDAVPEHANTASAGEERVSQLPDENLEGTDGSLPKKVM